MTLERERVHVLLIEDDEDDFFIARTLLQKARSIAAETEWARTYEEGLERLTSESFDVCLVDYRLGPRTGLDLLREALEGGADTPIILLTGQGDLEVDLQAMAAGASDYLVKGEIDAQALERSIRYARERRRAEERIREQAALLDEARDAILACDLGRRIVYWNRSAELFSGHASSAALGQPLGDYWHTTDADALEEAWAAALEQGAWSGELRQRSGESGNERIIESRWTLVRDRAGQPRSVLVINTDVTERKQLESQFLRSQRMESIGRLVGGIAHDLGNLLVPILLGAKVLQNRFEDDPKLMRTLSMIQKSAQRGSDMVKQVLAFARGVEGERAPLQVADVIQEVEKILSETLPPTIEIEASAEGDLHWIEGDATQVQQVLMNLCVNARDAMPSGGRLTLRAENAEVSERLARQHLEAEAGPYVRVTVTDTGEGIPPEVLDKVFEPFFTTKSVGKGTGLGLSTAYSIIKSHGGFITADSRPGEGTRFRFYLPAATAPQVLLADDEGGGVAEGAPGTGELVLIVDDEPYILEILKENLEELDYHVVTGSNGRIGLERFRQQPREIDLLITDLMMPEMDGLALIRAIKEERPDLPVVACSGVTGDVAREALQAGADLFLSKPFTVEKVAAALQSLLQGSH